MRIALFPGSFDPFTNGHTDILQAALKLADHLIIAVAVHPSKKSLFTFDERKTMIEEAVSSAQEIERKKIEVRAFDGLVVEFAKQSKANIIIRGIRDSTDLNYEMQMAGMNAVLEPKIQTVFIPSSSLYRPITATLVRQIAQMGGDVSGFVPENVSLKMRLKFKTQ
jgi:pantetheine-phosphate adenylyltransferase